MHHSYRFLVAVGALTVALTACSFHGPWNTLAEKGPRVSGGSEATVQERCQGQMPMSDVVRCERVLLTEQGDRVSISGEIEALERYLVNVPQIAPWITPPNGPNKGPGPYKLFLISFFPTIVVAVPQQRSTDWSCSGSQMKNGCIRSRAINLNSYWFRALPPIADGSFWFSPQLNEGSVQIDAHQPSITIRVGTSELSLAASNGEWKIEKVQ